jgi:hypothetical protein
MSINYILDVNYWDSYSLMHRYTLQYNISLLPYIRASERDTKSDKSRCSLAKQNVRREKERERESEERLERERERGRCFCCQLSLAAD